MSISGEVKRRLAALFGTAGKEVSDTLDSSIAASELLDVTPGTATASKAVVVDANRSVSNLGITGVSTLRASGQIEIGPQGDQYILAVSGFTVVGAKSDDFSIVAGDGADATEVDGNGADGNNVILQAGAGGAGDGEGVQGAHGLIILGGTVPTSDPGVAGALFTTAGALQVSAGS